MPLSHIDENLSCFNYKQETIKTRWYCCMTTATEPLFGLKKGMSAHIEKLERL